MPVTSRLCNAGDGTQGFVCARQGLEPVHTSSAVIPAAGRVRQEDHEFEANHADSEAMFHRFLQPLFQCSKYTGHHPGSLEPRALTLPAAHFHSAPSTDPEHT